jgi:hypothetical protein
MGVGGHRASGADGARDDAVRRARFARFLGVALVLSTILAGCGYTSPSTLATLACTSVQGANNGDTEDMGDCLAQHQ